MNIRHFSSSLYIKIELLVEASFFLIFEKQLSLIHAKKRSQGVIAKAPCWL